MWGSSVHKVSQTIVRNCKSKVDINVFLSRFNFWWTPLQWLVETLNTTNMVDRFSSQAMSLLWTYFPVDSFWGTRSTRRSWGTLPRRCCWPTRRSSTPSLTGGTSSPLGLSWCWKFLASWPGARCKLLSQREVIFHIRQLNSTHTFFSRKELIDI